MPDFSKLTGRKVYCYFLDEEDMTMIDITDRDDFVQVICCKDCRHWFDNACFVEDQHGEHPDSVILDRYTDDFCSKAERKQQC